LGLHVVKVDEKGRVLIPKDIRVKANIQRGKYVRLKVDNNKVILEALGSVTDKFRGIFHVEKWPEDLDLLVEEAIRKWWLRKSRSM